MKTKEKIILTSLTTILVYVIVYLLVKLLTVDLKPLTLPGWHTVIYSPEAIRLISTFLILALTFIIYVAYFQINRILINIGNKWKKMGNTT